MAKKQSAVARSIPPTVGASTLASLEGRATTESATAGVQVGLKTGNKFTGQYLFDRFVANDEAEISKLDIVRSMVATLDLASFKKVVADFVAVATGYRDNAIKAAKQAGTYDKEKPGSEIDKLTARVKTAANHQTVMRVAYGALKFAPEQLAKHGYDDTTGYQVMAVISRMALNDAGLKWDGAKQLSETEKQRKESAKAEEKALAKVMEANPRQEGENMAKYLARCSDKVQDQVDADRAEAETKMITDLIAKVRKLAGPMLDEVITGLLAAPEAPKLDEASAAEAAPAATKH